MKNKRGWVPAAYLEPMDGPDESEEQEPNYAGKTLRKARRPQEHGGVAVGAARRDQAHGSVPHV